MNPNSNKYLDLNKNLNRNFRRLQVWQESIELFRVVKQKLDGTKLSFKVKGQIEDSALSVSSNIAEGSCRRYIKENIQFLNIALASLGENYSQVFALFNAEIIEEDWFKKYDTFHYKLENKLIALNRTLISRLTKNPDWRDDYQIKEITEEYKINNN